MYATLPLNMTVRVAGATSVRRVMIHEQLELNVVDCIMQAERVHPLVAHRDWQPVEKAGTASPQPGAGVQCFIIIMRSPQRRLVTHVGRQVEARTSTLSRISVLSVELDGDRGVIDNGNTFVALAVGSSRGAARHDEHTCGSGSGPRCHAYRSWDGVGLGIQAILTGLTLLVNNCRSVNWHGLVGYVEQSWHP